MSLIMPFGAAPSNKRAGVMGSLGLTPTSTPMGQVNAQQKNAQQDTQEFANPWGVLPTSTPINQALAGSQQAQTGVAQIINRPWGVLPTSTPIGQAMQQSQNAANQISSVANSRMRPVNSGVASAQYTGPNSVQAARMGMGPVGGQFSSQDQRNAVLNAYNPTSGGVGGSYMGPPPQAPQPAPQGGPYNGGAWTATGNPYSAPGTKMGQTVQMTPQIANILAGGTGQGYSDQPMGQPQSATGGVDMTAARAAADANNAARATGGTPTPVWRGV